ncbi:MAG: HAMP domain-containing protein [Planctomycetes bacterium]|nr:HAMP domain-containing protein [Planctomycetota bacterium]
MRAKRLLWQLYLSYLLITLAALLAIGGFASVEIRRFYLQSVNKNLHIRARLVEQQIGASLDATDIVKLQAFSNRFGETTSTRITVIAPDGKVLCDTEQSPSEMENHGNRQEVISALAGDVGQQTRLSSTLRDQLTYLAIPVERASRIIAVVRTSVHVTEVDEAVRSVQLQVAVGGLLIAVLASLLSLFVSRRISRPLETMRRGAERFAAGDLSYEMPVPKSAELGGLAVSLNKMARQLEERIGTIVQQRNEREAVLTSMAEGVLAVDSERKVLNLNRAAARLLDVDEQTAVGRPVDEIARNADVRQLITEALAGGESVEADLMLGTETERILAAKGAALLDQDGKSIGAVIVLDDVTQVRRLESIRRDFVANVSHELKTPIAAIKGFVETLLDGAMDDRQDALRFLKIVAKQSDRLSAIIEDLLSLAKIEQAEGVVAIEMEPHRVLDVLEAARGDTSAVAEERGVEIVVECDAELTARFNPPLLEQALANLLDNAVKYSEAGSRVHLSAENRDGQFIIAVADQGCGIPAEHLSRLFERFYRVDKARSRKLGGTGLGLAIVKHIAAAHGGRVEVDSTPGRGSRFSIVLPQSAAER